MPVDLLFETFSQLYNQQRTIMVQIRIVQLALWQKVFCSTFPCLQNPTTKSGMWFILRLYAGALISFCLEHFHNQVSACKGFLRVCLCLVFFNIHHVDKEIHKKIRWL